MAQKSIKSAKVESEQNGKSLLREYVEAIIVALILALLIRHFIIQAFKIPSESMMRTLLVGDHILVNKFIYGVKIPFIDKSVLKLKKPQRGDVIVFTYPMDPDRDFIKRVVAVEGDVIQIRNKKLYVNDEEVEEPYVQHVDPSSESPVHSQRDYFPTVKIQKDHVFVMGDNRDNSHDSRFWGQLSTKFIKGKAFITYFSWDRTVDRDWGAFEHIPAIKYLCFNGGIRWGRFGHLIR